MSLFMPPSRGEEDLVAESIANDDVYEAGDRKRPEIEAEDAKPVQTDFACLRSIKRQGDHRQNKRHEEMEGAEAEKCASGIAQMDEESCDRRDEHQEDEEPAGG